MKKMIRSSTEVYKWIVGIQFSEFEETAITLPIGADTEFHAKKIALAIASNYLDVDEVVPNESNDSFDVSICFNQMTDACVAYEIDAPSGDRAVKEALDAAVSDLEVISVERSK